MINILANDQEEKKPCDPKDSNEQGFSGIAYMLYEIGLRQSKKKTYSEDVTFSTVHLYWSDSVGKMCSIDEELANLYLLLWITRHLFNYIYWRVTPYDLGSKRKSPPRLKKAARKCEYNCTSRMQFLGKHKLLHHVWKSCFYYSMSECHSLQWN